MAVESKKCVCGKLLFAIQHITGIVFGIGTPKLVRNKKVISFWISFHAIRQNIIINHYNKIIYHKVIQNLLQSFNVHSLFVCLCVCVWCVVCVCGVCVCGVCVRVCVRACVRVCVRAWRLHNHILGPQISKNLHLGMPSFVKQI